MPYSVYPLGTDGGDDPGARVTTIILWLLQVLYTPEGTEIAEIINERLRDLDAHRGDRPSWQLVRTQSTH